MEDINKIGIKEVQTLPKELSRKNLFTFYIKNFDFCIKIKKIKEKNIEDEDDEEAQDPISECLSHLTQIQNILDSEEKKSYIFFFFREKKFVKFYTKLTILFQ